MSAVPKISGNYATNLAVYFEAKKQAGKCLYCGTRFRRFDDNKCGGCGSPRTNYDLEFAKLATDKGVS